MNYLEIENSELRSEIETNNLEIDLMTREIKELKIEIERMRLALEAVSDTTKLALTGGY